MKNIVVSNRKGGVGKSLVSAEIVLSLRRSGINVNFYDLDEQGGNMLETSKEPGAKYSVVDCPGQLTDELPRWISEASVLVVPTRPSKPDIASLELMIDAFKANKRKGAR